MTVPAPAPANVYTIPPGVPFLAALARAILAGGFPASDIAPPGPLDLARWTVLLPTRRAARSLIDAFLAEGGGKARLLPRISALGDVEEEDLLFAPAEAGFDAMAPAISPLQRLFLLASLIRDWARKYPRAALAKSLVHSPVQALSLARSLAKLIDSFETEQVELETIASLIDVELANHQELVLEFLALVRVRLPEEMARLGLVSPAERRNRLMAEEAARLEAGGADGPVIAAGSTGSIPATARLLAVISHLPHGAVVLPGLDQGLERESWDQLGPQHPQYGMRELLHRMRVDRHDVRVLPGVDAEPERVARGWLASEIMRPAETSERWHEAVAHNGEKLATALGGLSAIAAPGQREEATAIALIMRRTLEVPGRTAALVTPDRGLARRVRAELKRWNLDIDDSAGEPLIRTPAGALAALLAEAAASGFAARELVALFNQPFCRFGFERSELIEAASTLEVAVLRGVAIGPGLAGLAEGLERAPERAGQRHAHPLLRRIDARRWKAARDLLDRLRRALGPLEDLYADDGNVALDELARAHVAAMEAATSGPREASPLWTGEVGEALANLFGELLEHAVAFAPLRPRDYAPLVASLMQTVAVRPRYGRHPRLVILGLLEARLVHADVTILGGLNENVWPAEAETDPWLNRPQRKSLKLQLPERRIGLAAHDFAQGLAFGSVHLTWSKKIGSQPAVPSRWVLRLLALLAAAKSTSAIAPDSPWLEWVKGLDPAGTAKPAARPRPRPPVAARPWKLSVTASDELIRDPYATFAHRILWLIPLDGLGGDYGPSERGQMVHAVLHRFTERHPGALPPDADLHLLEEARAVIDEMAVDEATAALWWPQMERMARWFIDRERQWRETSRARHVELDGQIEFPVGGKPFVLTGRADRIDELGGGKLRIIDYKTGQIPSFSDTAKAYSPQLLIEAYMAAEGGFPGIAKGSSVGELMYVRLSGGDPAGETAPCKDDVTTLAEHTAAGLKRLLEGYADPATPYEARDWSRDPDKAREYGHLSRWREWAAESGGST
ncbi:MAG TPA: double-strand break repair protein AddB [Aestuariivirgaceae bacterium]|nr:double-strand break repair protein AddB [Aestuariivirgaceae bacterium]